MRLFYQFGIASYSILLHLASLLGHRKAILWLNGRKNWRNRISEKFRDVHSSIWIHCASLGEYELSVPLIKELKVKHPTKHIIVTFFSPSGFEVKKNESLVFHVDYLPIDSSKNARDFIKLIRPELVFFAKYDYWYYYLNELKKQGIPTYVFSASFRSSQVFFKSYGGWYRKMLLNFTMLFVIDKKSEELLQSIGINNVLTTGDTRYDRVSSTVHINRNITHIDKFKSTNQLVIIGSSWPEDEAVFIPFINTAPQGVKFIIAPHEIDENRIQDIEKKLCVTFMRYSTLGNNSYLENVQVLIMDNIGMLSALYKYGNIAYVGGAFKQGLHNILEPLSFGLPVLFGPHIKKFPEAVLFSEAGGAISIDTSDKLATVIKTLLNSKEQIKINSINVTLINHQVGSTNKILNNIEWKN